MSTHGNSLFRQRRYAMRDALKVFTTFFLLPCLAATTSLLVISRFVLIERRDTANQVAWIDDAYRLIRDRHVDSPDRDDLAFSAIRGMAGSLDDYSDFIDPYEYASFREQNEGIYVGIGFQLYPGGEPVTVLRAFPGSPAERAGLLPGDRIIGVDGESCEGMSNDEVTRRIKLENGGGTTLHLRVQPYFAEGSTPPEPIDLSLQRQSITLPSVYDPRVVDDEHHVGYVRIAAFQNNTAKELKGALKELSDQGIQSLVIDLRQNRGGLLDQAIDVASLFLEEEQLVVSTEGRSDSSNHRYLSSDDAGAYRDLSLAILMDERTASASEVVAGALKDHYRAVLVGVRSFGKGMVQSVIECKYRVEDEERTGLLKITTSRYLTPSGRAIDKETGLVPDVWATLDDGSAKLLNAHFSDREIPPATWELIRERTAYEPIAGSRFHDRQLDRAIAALTGDRLFNTVY